MNKKKKAQVEKEQQLSREILDNLTENIEVKPKPMSEFGTETAEFYPPKMEVDHEKQNKSKEILNSKTTEQTLTVEQKRKLLLKKKRRNTLIFGILMILFSAVGLFYVVNLSIGFISQSFLNSNLDEEFSNLVKPVVMYDPLEFDNVEQAEPKMLLQTAMWNVMMNNVRTKYEQNDLNYYLVPAGDLDVQAAKIFGVRAKLEHQTFGDYVNIFEYNAETSMYAVPPNIQSEGIYFEPNILKSVKNEDGTWSVEVGYMSAPSMWEENLPSDEKTVSDIIPEKIKQYILDQTIQGNYFIKSIKNLENEYFEELMNEQVSIAEKNN